MEMQQFEDKNLSHYSYAILSECEKQIVLIDPARNTEPYLAYAEEADARIIGVIETHPHADFVSSHLELHQTTGATIYTSKEVEANYPHQTFDEGDTLAFGKIKLSALNTPGHSPDSISIVLEHNGKTKAVFTGDTLFIGDCGRPDLRPGNGDVEEEAKKLAHQMYHSLRDKLMQLPDDTLVYPAHGAGTLCGKNLSQESRSTIGKEKETNWSLQQADEEEFVSNLLADQPFVPAYFTYDVALNKQGAAPLQQSIGRITRYNIPSQLDAALWVVDVRKEDDFKKGHLPHSVNIQIEGKFETWLGSIIKPGEAFYLAARDEEQLQQALMRTAAIGYESLVSAAIVVKEGTVAEPRLDVAYFKQHTSDYTIVDVRNKSEVEEDKIFADSISIPLAELRERTGDIPTGKPVAVHCAGGYRSAAASSLIGAQLNGAVKVFDISDAIKQFTD